MQSPLDNSTKPELHPVPDAQMEGLGKTWDKKDPATQSPVGTILYELP